MATAKFNGNDTARVHGLWQWDFAQVLRIDGLELEPDVEVHFSLTEKDGGSETRIGATKDGVTEVEIPNEMLKNEGCTSDYNIYAFIYITDETSGKTVKKIIMYVNARPKPGEETMDTPEDRKLFREAIQSVNDAVKKAESWAHGSPDYPESVEDNAAYYAGKAKDIVSEIPEHVEAGKKSIDAYVESKRAELKGDTGNVYFASFKVVNGRLKMYSNPSVDKIRFARVGSRLKYRLAM